MGFRSAVSVVVPILDPRDIRAAMVIDSLDAQCEAGDEVIGIFGAEVVNDGLWQRNGCFRQTRLVQAGEVCRAALLNRGVREARNGVVLLCGEDCLKVPGALDQARGTQEGRALRGLTCFLGRIPTERRMNARTNGQRTPREDLSSLYHISEDDEQEWNWLLDGLAIHKRDLKRAGGLCEEFTGTGHRDGACPDLLDRLCRVTQVRLNRHMQSIHLWHPVDAHVAKDQEEKATRLLNMRREERRLGTEKPVDYLRRTG